jgi:hypothetical protein
MEKRIVTEHPKGLMIGEGRAFVERIAWYSLGIVNVLANTDEENRRKADAGAPRSASSG